jgi:phage FluMu protein Com
MVFCPRCKKEVEALPVLSMKDERTLLCAECGILEVFERDGKDKKEKKCPRCGIFYRADRWKSKIDGSWVCPICAAKEVPDERD